MRTLEQHLSDNPNRRKMPTFLLWNADKENEKNDLRRLWFYRQFGIHLLYDTEVGELADPNYAKPTWAKTEKREQRMNGSIKHLRMIADAAQYGPLMHPQDEKRVFRSPQEKYDNSATQIPVWGIEQTDSTPPQLEFAEEVVAALLSTYRVKVIEGESGACKGSCAFALAQAIEARHGAGSAARNQRVISINASFSFETDSLSAVLSGGYDGSTAFAENIGRLQSAKKAVEDLLKEIRGLSKSTSGNPLKPKENHLTIIINGADRFIAHDGAALSSEIDSLVRIILNATNENKENGNEIKGFFDDLDKLETLGLTDFRFPIQLILIGTRRVRRYLDAIAGSDSYEHWRLKRDGDGKPFLSAPNTQSPFLAKCGLENATGYFARLGTAFSLPVNNSLISDKTHRRRVMFGTLLDPDFLLKQGAPSPELALEILRSMAFVGQPIESNILFHLPRIATILVNDKIKLRPTFDWLLEKKLVLRILPFNAKASRRYGLHKTLVTEFRERHGVPLTDSRLAAGFNLSLFAAQTSDNYVPDLAWHDDLGSMVDWLLGAYRDDFEKSPPEEIKNLNWDEVKSEHRMLSFYENPDFLQKLGSAEMANCLRGAIALLRGYYSVPALLMQDNRSIDMVKRDGPLTEHGERLRRVIRLARDISAVRGFIRKKLEKTPNIYADYCSLEPLYADDLLWVQNEYAVVKTTQGELYKARAALREAERLNENFVEFGKYGPNWMRLQMNQVQLDIERGKIVPAEERLRDIELAINENGRIFATSYPDPYQFIVGAYRDYRALGDIAITREDFPLELTLLSALALGYKGLCDYLRGELESAEDRLTCSVRMLSDLNEMRAYSFFQKHLASLFASQRKTENVEDALRLCISAAGPGRQPDIDHSGRIAAIQYSVDLGAPNAFEEGPEKRIPQLMASYRYALASDMYRLQVETAQVLALVHLANGDTHSALNFVHEAMAIAARGGFSLRKISLRILLGRIHLARREPRLASNLFTSATKLATRIRYERAVEAAENELIKC
jgi:tetratricopeptide (TPR) repeat protein